MTVYFISGLGADKRIFQKLQLSADLSIRYLEWLEPLKAETLVDYSRRLAENIDTSEDFALVGLSFGGMVATELSQIVHPKHTIIISSAGCRKELPWYYKLAGYTRLHIIVPTSLLKVQTPFSFWFFGAQSKETRQFLKLIIHDTSPKFLKWAIRSILSWKRREKPEGIYHIHGSSDHVLPPGYVKANIIVPAGGHLMVFDMASVISRLLDERLHVQQ